MTIQRVAQADEIKIGNVSVKRGERKRGAIVLGQDFDGSPIELPVIVCRGERDGPRLWINAAIHGDEPEGTLSVFRLLGMISPKTLSGTLIVVPAQNADALMSGERGNPADTFTYDMNRIYPGKPDGRMSERFAHAHWLAMQDNCDLQISIHSGGNEMLLSHMIFAPENPGSRELAAAMGPRWDLVFISSVEKGTPNAALTQLNKTPSITVENGGSCRTLTGDLHAIVDEMADSLLNVMRHYGMVEGKAAYAPKWRMGRQKALLAPVNGLFMGRSDLKFETRIGANELLGTIYNLYGDVTAEIRSPTEGVVFGLRSRPATRIGEWCCFFGLIDAVVDDLLPRNEKR
jgi:predicted deacylase